MKPVRLAALLIAFVFLFAAAQCVSRLGGSAPSTLTQATQPLEHVLANIAYTSPAANNDAGVVYQISFRTCPPCIQSHENILPKLHAAGLETRLVTTARRHRYTDKERAAVVENIRRKDWSFTQDWWADRNPKRFYAQTQLPPVDGNGAREAELAQLQNHVDEVRRVLAQNGLEFAFPTLIWKAQDGTYKTAIGYNPNLTANILSDMGRE